MKVKLSEYIADFLVRHEIKHVFTITGGGAMHLNDSLGHKRGLACVYNHHEQACAIAAEAYARFSGKIAAVCVSPAAPAEPMPLPECLADGWIPFRCS